MGSKFYYERDIGRLWSPTLEHPLTLPRRGSAPDAFIV
jgi:hypothetical protein